VLSTWGAPGLEEGRARFPEVYGRLSSAATDLTREDTRPTPTAN